MQRSLVEKGKGGKPNQILFFNSHHALNVFFCCKYLRAIIKSCISSGILVCILFPKLTSQRHQMAKTNVYLKMVKSYFAKNSDEEELDTLGPCDGSRNTTYRWFLLQLYWKLECKIYATANDVYFSTCNSL